jgi:hypothetical protein
MHARLQKLKTVKSLKAFAKELDDLGYRLNTVAYSTWKSADKAAAKALLLEIVERGPRRSPSEDAEATPNIGHWEDGTYHDLVIDENNLDVVLTKVHAFLLRHYPSNNERNARLQPYFMISSTSGEREQDVALQPYDDINDINDINDMLMEEDDTQIPETRDEDIEQLFFDAQQPIEEDLEQYDLQVLENPDEASVSTLSLLNIEPPKFLARQTQFIRPVDMNRLLRDLESTPSKIDVLKNYPNINDSVQRCIGIQLL